MNRALSAWDRAQEERLQELRSSISDRGVLRRLLETSCLLELSKLACAQPRLVSYLEHSLEVVSQFLALDGCALELEPPGLPRLCVERGDDQGEAAHDPGSDGRTAIRLALHAGGEPVGRLVLRPADDEVDADFADALAAHLSQGLGAVLEAEQLRRRAARAQALRLAASLVAGPERETLEPLAEALASLPGALGAELRLVAGAPVDSEAVSAGLLGAGVRQDERLEASDGVALEVALEWAEEPTPDARALVGEILAAIGGGLASWRERRHLEVLAETDPLTELGNRRRGYRELSAALSRAERFAESVAVIALDLDHFKQVNDRLGHPAGDDVLRQVADVLRGELRGYDGAVRLGGEEFLVICPGTGLQGATTVARRILEAVPRRCAEVLPAGWRQTVSAGIAVFPQHGDFPDALLRTADQALYQAKKAGRDRVAFAPDPVPAAAGSPR